MGGEHHLSSFFASRLDKQDGLETCFLFLWLCAHQRPQVSGRSCSTTWTTQPATPGDPTPVPPSPRHFSEPSPSPSLPKPSSQYPSILPSPPPRTLTHPPIVIAAGITMVCHISSGGGGGGGGACAKPSQNGLVISRSTSSIRGLAHTGSGMVYGWHWTWTVS